MVTAVASISMFGGACITAVALLFNFYACSQMILARNSQAMAMATSELTQVQNYSND